MKVIKALAAAAALTAFAAPAYAVTASECVGLGGVVNLAAGTCVVSDGAAASSAPAAGGLGGLGVAAPALVGLALVLVVMDDSDSSSTT